MDGPGWHKRWFPEGYLVPLFLLAFVGVVTFSVQYGDWPGIVIPVGLVGILATLFGMALVKVRVSESIAHLGSLVAGTVTVSGMLVLVESDLGDGWRERIRPLGHLLMDWYFGRPSDVDHRDLLVSMLMGLIVWLVGYLTVWTLYQRGWLLAALLLPGLLALVNLGYAPEPRPAVIAVLVAVAIPLAARFSVYQRQLAWERGGMRSPRALGGRVATIATVVALLITSASWNVPESWSQSSLQPAISAISEQILAARDRAESWMGRNGAPSRDAADAGSYTAFDDAFSVGGPLELTDREEVLVRTGMEQAPYLTAHRYDRYTGRGWESAIDDGFRRAGPDGQSYSPELLFQPGQSVVLSDDVAEGRGSTSMEVTPLAGPQGVLLTVDAYQSSSIPAVVRMSWQQLDEEPFPLAMETLTALPPDIQRISHLLLQAELTGTLGDYGVTAADGEVQERIDGEVAALRSRLISVRWDTDGAGKATVLYVSGQLPTYDDVEAVFPRNAFDAAAGESYTVTGLTSTADAADLSGAGVEYPAWVTDRYLQLGDTVTPRTIDLTLEIAGEGETPYEQAVLVRDWLRTNIAYDERVEAPPADDDVVDYVLFDHQRGYCEHYASAMTVMMRALGVPARTVVGYYPGELDTETGGFLYRQQNAHAWTEIFFPGYGWIPFEPTANRPLGEFAQEGEILPEMPEPTQPAQESTPTAEPADSAATPMPEHPPLENPGPPAMIREDDGETPNWVAPVAVGVSAVVLVGGGLWLAWTWSLRGLAPSAALYRRLERVGRIGGVRATPTTTPREYAVAFERSVPRVGPSARRIVQVYESDQFGREAADEGRLASAREAWRRVRSLIPTMLLRRRR